MILNTHKNKWLLIALIGTALVPILITTFEIITSGKESVIFLENYNPIIAIILITYYIALVALGVFWLTTQLISYIRLKNEGVNTELMLLKSQVNPHFFFNMLNNLYGLVGKDAKKAQELILKLSDLMRYSIYEGEKDSVPLKQEVDYLNNYIELHKMRYHKTININFHQDIKDDYEVMPLLFIILLENAFKHGVERLRDDAFVNISMLTSENGLYFTVENNFDNLKGVEEPGIGLKNLKRRLELVYPNRHKLSFEALGNVYTVQLTLKDND
ncbi:MAG: two-component system sensor histidine kinase AlgZ [Salibacteraceae bacterium]|jgi:two-component system sensor histidine kinase AlgZ